MSLKLKLLLSLAVAIITGLIAGYTASKIYYSNHQAKAEVQAKLYAKKMGIELVGASCMNQDTDRDHYVSCTLREKTGKMHNLQCVGNIPFWHVVANDGCKIPKVNIQPQ